MSIEFSDDTCTITCEDNGKQEVVDIIDWKEHQYINVYVNKSVKLNLRWNGRIYEGGMAGLSFVTEGPKTYSYNKR